MRRYLVGSLLLLVVLVAVAIGWLWRADQYAQDGTVRLSALAAPVRVVRDEQGVPYIHAGSLDDLWRAQGFVAAQDHLFSIEFSRYLAYGRLAEVIGEAGLQSDVTMRVVGIGRHARRHAAMLRGEERRRRELYLEGLNAFIRDHAGEHPVGLRLLGIRPQPWTLEDSMTLSYFVNWASSSNLAAELISQAILARVGPAKAAEIAQLSINPDDGSEQSATPVAAASAAAFESGPWAAMEEGPMRLGSNGFAVSGARSASGAPVLASDPHIDARTLPGRWQPVGLITPEIRAVGAAGPGLPGLAVARTNHIAYGVTNSYGDVVDLYVEREDPADPARYLDGDRSVPFDVIAETIRVRERGSDTGFREQPLRIRLTRRGPVISDHGMAADSGALLSLRWTTPETMRPDDTGGSEVFLARNVAEARAAIAHVNAPYNYIVADTAGSIAHITAGRVPVRLRGDGSAPLPADGTESWGGMIPPEQMPAMIDPERGWVGNSNQRTVKGDYPYRYSTYFSASWRYRRMIELLDPAGRRSAVEYWHLMWDTKNMLAAQIVPLMADALARDLDTRPFADELRAWDFRDDTDAVAPSIFQATWREFARLTFEDELGPGVTARMLDNWYYWHERLARLCNRRDDPWFDDVTTPAVEDRDELFRRAARRAADELRERLGPDLREWRWGRLHTVTFFSPVVPGRWAAALLGAGTRPKDGSGETLNRAIYRYAAPYDATVIASLRFVADLADPDKVLAAVAGGASGRQFSPHKDDQLAAWETGARGYWWFSDAEIERHARHEQLLKP